MGLKPVTSIYSFRALLFAYVRACSTEMGLSSERPYAI